MLVDIVAKKFCKEKNGVAFIRRKFDRNWNVEDNSTFSFAHDIETSWLMIDAMRVLGKDCSDPSIVRRLSKEMIKNVYEHGMERVGSGYALRWEIFPIFQLEMIQKISGSILRQF